MNVGGCARRDRGAADALGLVLVAPVAIALALVVVFLGRQVDARAQVRSAAEAAAQAAARQRSGSAARAAAHDVLDALLPGVDVCESSASNVDLRRFAPGGEVAVTVACEVSDRGLGLLAPPERSFTATAWAAIDPHRSAGGTP